MKIGKKIISEKNEPFIIAEMSGNHNNSIETALKIVEAAASAGADAIKLQTFTPEDMTLDIKDKNFKINDKKSPWYGKRLFELYQLAHTPLEWHQRIINLSNKLGLICFSSIFNENKIKFLEKLNMPAYKIASFENNHLPLIKSVAKTGKPIIISTGLASLKEIDEAVNSAKESGCKELGLLKCTSSYPAKIEDSNLSSISKLKSIYDFEIGLSDHTLGISAALAAVALGATIIEKHLTLSRKNNSVDSSFSLEPHEFKQLVEESKNVWKSLGNDMFELTNAEERTKIFRRSIYISKNLKAGEILNETNVKIIRPNFGLHPREFKNILGKKIVKDASKGTPLSKDLLNNK